MNDKESKRGNYTDDREFQAREVWYLVYRSITETATMMPIDTAKAKADAAVAGLRQHFAELDGAKSA